MPATQFLCRPAKFGWCLVAFALLGSGSPAATTPLGDLTGPWQLFVDDHLVASREHVVRTWHSFKKHSANPILVADKPWEHKVVDCRTVLPDATGTGWRMWYCCDTAKRKRRLPLYATSTDGIVWTKPNLGLVPWEVSGSTENNIIQSGGSVMHTPHDPDPARRYKAMLQRPYRFSCSPDGIHWRPLSKQDFLVKTGDVGFVIWDPLTGKYRGYIKVNPHVEVRGLRRRVVGYSEGTGFESWPELRPIMLPDEIDDRWCRPGSTQCTHFYGCPVVPYETLYLGLLWIFRAEDHSTEFDQGPIFNELVSSRDGIHWQREEGGRPAILDRGAAGAWDAGMVLGTSVLRAGNELRLYYTGYRQLHGGEPQQAGVGLATLRKDGFVSLDAGEQTGTVVTRRLGGVSGRLHVNYQASRGQLQVEVLDESGEVLAGYGREDCTPLKGDEVDGVVTWRERAELPGGDRPVRLRFILVRASLYSFMAGDAVTPLPDTAAATRAKTE